MISIAAWQCLQPVTITNAQSIVQQRYARVFAGTIAQSLAPSPKGGWTYLVGSTTDANYPTTEGAFDRTCGTDGRCNETVGRFGLERRSDIVFTVVDAAGETIYSTYIGGAGQDDNPAIAVARDGTVWIAARKATPGLENSTAACAGDLWIARFDYMLRRLEELWCTSGSVADLAVDDQDHAWLLGTTSSTPIATVNAFQPTPGGQLDMFVEEFVAGEPAPRMATYLGGSGLDIAMDLAVTPSGAIAIAGYTNSPNYPLVRPVRSVPPSSVVFNDAVVSVLDRSGRFLQFSTQWGGARDDRANGIAVDRDGNVYVAGSTQSIDMATTAGAADSGCGTDQQCNATLDAFVAKFSATGEVLASTYYGGSGVDFGRGIAWRPNGQVLLLGGTQSADFPLVNSQPFQRWHPAVNFEHSFVATFDDRLSRVMRSAFVGDESYLPNVPRFVIRNEFTYVAGQVTTLTGATAPGTYLTAVPLQ